MANCYRLGQGTIIRFQGNDRSKVINNLCTQDLRKCSEGYVAETFVTDVKGRTVGHGLACGMTDEIWFVTVPGQANRLVPHFERYIIREDAIITDVSQSYAMWLFANYEAAGDALGLDSQRPGPRFVSSHHLHGESIVLLSAPWIGSESCVAIVPSLDQEQHLREHLALDWIESDLTHRTAWECKRIQSFWPWYGVDLDDRNLPQEVDRNADAISFHKGCYLGQETIARLDALGQVQKKLVQVTIESSELPSTEIPFTDGGKEVGQLRSVAIDPSQVTYIGLAYIKRSHFQIGQELEHGGCKARVS
jgi:folate-binding protein YgfZ